MIVPAVNEFELILYSVPLGTQPTTTQGTAVTPGNLSYGSYVQIPVMNGATTATSDDSCEVEICINSVGIAATARDCLVTIGWDPAGGTNYGVTARTSIVDLLGSCASSYAGGGNGFSGGINYRFNLRIPAGSTIAAKAMVNSATLTAINVTCKLRCRPTRPEMLWVGTFVDTYGSTPASASGTAVTPGTAARGAYVSLGVLTTTYYQFEFGVGCNDTTMGNLGYEVDVSIGDATNKDLVIDSALVTANNAEVMTKAASPRTAVGGSGATLFGRMQANTTPDSSISMAAYAVGG